jgi:hypothetical protein
MNKRSRLPRTPRQLPVVTVEGRRFFIDRRLGELRAVDNPHVRRPIPFGW